MTPSTQAGKHLAAIPLVDGDDVPLDLTEDIIAIEAEAAASATIAALDRLASRVDALAQAQAMLARIESGRRRQEILG